MGEEGGGGGGGGGRGGVREVVVEMEVGLVGWVAEVAVDEVAEEDLLDFGGNEGGNDEQAWALLVSGNGMDKGVMYYPGEEGDSISGLLLRLETQGYCRDRCAGMRGSGFRRELWRQDRTRLLFPDFQGHRYLGC